MTEQSAAPRSPPTVLGLFLSFLRLGAVSFGGPAMVPYIGRLAVTQKRWLAEDEFRQGVALCQALPGATAMQCAAYVGFRALGLRGAAAAYVGFGLPAFLLMFGLALAYRHAIALASVTSVLAGLRALVVALIANAAWTFGRGSVRSVREAAIAAATAAAFLIGFSPFSVVIAAGLAGGLLLRPGGAIAPPQAFSPITSGSSLKPPAIVLGLGLCLMLALALLDPKLARIGFVMAKVDLFAFGGGFASVPLMFDEIVTLRHWVPASVFMDGIALGQVTPGPIVITATFVGYQAAGPAGAVVGTVFIFIPSLFTVVLVEPWFTKLRGLAGFAGCSRGFVLSFVGLVASVALRFARLTPWDVPSVAIAAGALLALLAKVDVVWVVLAGAAVSALVM